MNSSAAAAHGVSPCQAIISTALQTIQDKCSAISRNAVCYGSDQITTQFVDNLTLPQFNALGDVVAINQVKSLVTSPLNVAANTWGLAVLKLQANLPDTMPGQNVTFLVYGNTQIDNTSGDMKVFYFSSGIGSPTCTEMPTEGIVVQSPNHTQVSFTANGVKIQIASTILLHANANKTLDVTLLEGHATVSTGAGAQTLLPGQMVSVPMGGTTGLDAVAAPSTPTSLDPNIVQGLDSLIAEAQTISLIPPIVATGLLQPTILVPSSDNNGVGTPDDKDNVLQPTDVPLATEPTDTPLATGPTEAPKAPKPTEAPKAPKPTEAPKAPKPTEAPKAPDKGNNGNGNGNGGPNGKKGK